MCSVPGLADVGSDITLHITTVHLNPHSVLVQFGGTVNPEQETSEVYQQIKDTDVKNERQDNFEGDPGVVCYVYDDKTWHRARILSKEEDEYNVFLIDKGKLFWASRNVLAKCPANVFSQPPTVELCVLTSASPLCVKSGWSDSASAFIRSLCGKNICGRVQDVMMPSRILLLDVSSISKEMHELGFATKISDEDLKSLVISSLHSPKGSASTKMDIAMPSTHDNDSESETFHQYLYPELLPGTIEIVTVMQVIHPFKVFCKLHVFSQELKKLSDQLHKCHEDASPCLMSQPLSDGSPCATKGSDGKWYRSVLQQSTVSDVVKVFHVDYGIGDFVKLCNIRPLSARFFQLPVVTYACSLNGIVDKGMGWRTDQIDFLKSLVLDQIFIGKFEQRDLCEGLYHVTLYGNDNVNVNSVFGLKEDCLSLAEKMCADKTLETLNKVTYRSMHDGVLKYSLHKNALTGSCEDDAAAPRTEAHLERRMQSPTDAVAGSLVHQDAYVRSPPKIEVGTEEKVWITCVKSVNQFYGHFAKNTDTVKKMTRDIQQLCCKRSQTKFSVSPKMMCFAKYTDGCWHRGLIESAHPKILVHFVDYGNLLALDKSEILPLTPEARAVASIPIQAIEFELSNVTLPESCELNEWFENYAADAMFSVTVMKKNTLGKLSVEMYDEKTNLNLKLIEKSRKTKGRKQGFPINKEADKTHACKVFSEAVESKRQRERFSTTTQAHQKMAKPVIQATMEQNCNFSPIKVHTAGRRRAERDDSSQQVVKQQKVTTPYPKLADLPSKVLNKGHVSEVYLSHCNSPSSFYVHLTSEDQIYSLLNKLNCSPLSSAQVDLRVLQPGDLVQAEYPADGAWYRAVVQNKDDDKVQVQFIDLGDEVTLPPIKMRQIDKRFLNMPRLSVHCSIEDGKSGGKRDWTAEQVKAFKKAAGENKILCKFIQCNRSVWLVRLETQGVVLEGPLFNASHAQTISQMPHTDRTQPLTFKEPDVKEGQMIEVYASSICGPNYFWCQFKNSEELDRISLMAQEYGNSTQTKPIEIDQLCQGAPCLARFSDELWYRARVINKLANTVSVLFLDYGNESEIDVNSVRSLSPELLERPPQAFLCQLGGFGSTSGTWSDAASDHFYELLVDEPLKVMIQNTVMASDVPVCPQYNVLVKCKGLVVNDLMKDYWCDPKLQIYTEAKLESVQFSTKEDCVNALMLPKDLAQHLPQATNLPPRVIKTGMVSEIYISHVISLRNFFVQLADDENTLFSLSEQLNSSEFSEKDVIDGGSVQLGSLVKAIFPEDGCWYRAVIKGTAENGMTQVEFIDFGNNACVSPSNICRLDEQLLLYPRFSVHCSSNIEDQFNIQKGLEEEVSLFKKIFGQVGENKLSCKFIKEHAGTWEVKVVLKGSTSEKWDDSDLNRLEIHSAKQAEVSIPVEETVHQAFSKPDVSLGQTVEAFASCIVGPNYFWCQFANSEQLDQVSLIAQEYGNTDETHPTLDHLHPGTPCLARFSDDLMWYRAQVIKIYNDTISVLFVDYGNESDISKGSVKALPCNLFEHSPQAFLCRLEGFASSEGSWDDTAADHFHELLVDKPLKITVNAIENAADPNNPPYSVTIEMQQCQVNELMKNLWSASVSQDQKSAEVRFPCENYKDNPIASEINVSLHEAGKVEEFIINDLHEVPENKVNDQLDETDMVATITHYNPIAHSLIKSDLLLANHIGFHESVEVVHVASVEKTQSHAENSRKETEDAESEKDAAPATPNRRRTWTASLENKTLPVVYTD